MLCRQCGKKVGRNSKYCFNCGAKVAALSSRLERGIALFSNGEYEKALQELEKEYATHRENADLLRSLGHAYLHGGKQEEALTKYEEALQFNLNYVDVHFNLGLIFLNKGLIAEALSHLTTALQLDPRFTVGDFYLGLIYNSVDHFLADCHFYLGLALKEKGQMESSIREFKKATELNANHLLAYCNLGDSLMTIDKFKEAIGTYRRAIELAPPNLDLLEVHNNLGIAYYKSGEIEKAISEFKWVIGRDPQNTNAIYNLGLIYVKEGMANNTKGDYRALIKTIKREIDGEAGIGLIGKSPKIGEVLKIIKRAAASDSTVLILGENGTGKELVARAIHQHSSRREQPFVTINCAAIPEGLLESELFGHEKGSFTGAVGRKLGKFEIADKGTAFLDEIGELSPSIQVKLLRVLQERAFERIGGTKTIKVDVRIIAATNRNLQEAIRKGSFREDLYYRLNVISISLPPLRERREDIPLLVSHFLKRYCLKNNKNIKRVSPEATELLVDYSWPGNVRELENVIERAVVLGTGEVIGVENLPPNLLGKEEDILAQAIKNDYTLKELEKAYILQVLKKTDGHQARTAKILGIDPSTLWRKLNRLGIKTGRRGLQNAMTKL